MLNSSIHNASHPKSLMVRSTLLSYNEVVKLFL